MAKDTPERNATFEGFADADGRFFKALAKNQKREWFHEHKHEYVEGWEQPMLALLTESVRALDRAYPDCELEPPKIFRIHRDVRFAKDKSPYKTHIGGVLPMHGKNPVGSPIALYVQVGTESFAGAGQYSMDGPSLAKFRAAVLEPKRGAELGRMIARLEAKGYRISAMETLKKVPKGVDPTHPRAELLKHKGLVLMFPAMPKGLLAKRALLDWTVTHAKAVAPVVRWLVFATA
ncbi:MAG TPA: DUF2461 domain-containing protein [Polyangiaceae bacterium]